MGNILQRSSPEVKNLTQFSLLKGLRNYLPSQVERVLRASASLWPFDNRPWSLSPRSPISNQDAQQELDTTPKSLEYLTINKAKTDLAVQRQLPQPTPKLKCRESHGKPGKNSRGVKIPDSGSGDSRCNHTGAEETTDSQVTSDHIKELSQDKRKGSLSVEVPETMKNTLSRDSMRSAFHPVIRKRPGSSFVPRPEKEKRSLDMSLLLEECVDCCALCSGLAARSSGSRAGDAKPKMRRNDAVPTGTSSSQQRGLVNSPSTQISLKPAPSTQQVLRNSKSVSGDRLTSTLAQGLQRPSKYLEGKCRNIVSHELWPIYISNNQGYHKQSFSPEKKDNIVQECLKTVQLEKRGSKQFPSTTGYHQYKRYTEGGLTNNLQPDTKITSLKFDKGNAVTCTNAKAVSVTQKWANGPGDHRAKRAISGDHLEYSQKLMQLCNTTHGSITDLTPKEAEFLKSPSKKGRPIHRNSKKNKLKEVPASEKDFRTYLSDDHGFDQESSDPQEPSLPLREIVGPTTDKHDICHIDHTQHSSRDSELPKISAEALGTSSKERGVIKSYRAEEGYPHNAICTWFSADPCASAAHSLGPLQFQEGPLTLSIPTDWTFTPMTSQAAELAPSTSAKGGPMRSSTRRRRVKQATAHRESLSSSLSGYHSLGPLTYDQQSPSSVLTAEAGLTHHTVFESDIEHGLSSSGYRENPSSLEQAQASSTHMAGALPTSTQQRGSVTYGHHVGKEAVDEFCYTPGSLGPLQFSQGPVNLSIPADWRFEPIASLAEDPMQSPSSPLGPIRYNAKERRSKQIAPQRQGIRTPASEQHGFQQPCPIPGVPGSTFPAQGDLTPDISGEGDQHFTVPSFGCFEHPKPAEKLPETTESRDVAVALCSKGDTKTASYQGEPGTRGKERSRGGAIEAHRHHQDKQESSSHTAGDTGPSTPGHGSLFSHCSPGAGSLGRFTALHGSIDLPPPSLGENRHCRSTHCVLGAHPEHQGHSLSLPSDLGALSKEPSSPEDLGILTWAQDHTEVPSCPEQEKTHSITPKGISRPHLHTQVAECSDTLRQESPDNISLGTGGGSHSFSAPWSMGPLQFPQGSLKLSIPADWTFTPILSQEAELTVSPSTKGAHKWPSPVKRRLKQETSEQGHESTPPTVHLGSGLPVSDPQGTSSVTLSQGGITPGTSDEWDPDLIVHSLESVDRSSSSDQAQGTHANTGGVLAKLTHEEGALVNAPTTMGPGDPSSSRPASLVLLKFPQGPLSLSIPADYTTPSQTGRLTPSSSSKGGPICSHSTQSTVENAVSAQRGFSKSSSDHHGLGQENPNQQELSIPLTDMRDQTLDSPDFCNTDHTQLSSRSPEYPSQGTSSYIGSVVATCIAEEGPPHNATSTWMSGDPCASAAHSLGPLQFQEGPLTLSIPTDWTFTPMTSQAAELTPSTSAKGGPMRSSTRRRRVKQATAHRESLSSSLSGYHSLGPLTYDQQSPSSVLTAEAGLTHHTVFESDIEHGLSSSGYRENPSSLEQAQASSTHMAGALPTSTQQRGSVTYGHHVGKEAVDEFCYTPGSLGPLQFSQGPVNLSIPADWRFEPIASLAEDPMQSPSSPLGPIRHNAKERRSKQIAPQRQGIRTPASEQHGFQQPCPIPGVPGSTFPAQGDLTPDISGEGDQHFTVPSFGSFEHPKPAEKLPETTESRDVAVALCSKGDTKMASYQGSLETSPFTEKYSLELWISKRQRFALTSKRNTNISKDFLDLSLPYKVRNQEHTDTITPQGTRSTRTPSYHKDPGAPGRLHTTRTQEHSDAITPQVPRSTQTPLQHKPHAGTQEHQTPLD
ncbi:hypothetical protein STEG23_034615 [Scotinomys teguina]